MSLSDEVLFRDGIGDRLLIRDAHGRPAQESLLIRPELSSIPSFEFALNERLWLVEKFDHPGFLTVKNIVRHSGRLTTISLIHDLTGGVRLSDVLMRSETSARPISLGATMFLLRELLNALSDLHRQSGDLSHGALAPERVVLADGRVRIADYVLATAIEQLRFSTERYWKELRVAVPPSAGGVRLDRRVDVAQVAMIAVAMFAGRPLRDSEHMAGLGDALLSISVPQPIRGWLLRALHMDPRRVFVHAGEGLQALSEAMAEASISAAPKDLEAIVGGRTSATTFTVAPSRAVVAPAPSPPPPLPPAPKPPAAPVRAAPAPTVKPSRQLPKTYEVDVRPLPQPLSSRLAGWKLMTPRFRKYLWMALLAVVMTGAFTAAQYIPAPEWLFSNAGTLVIESNPEGVPVLVNGISQGVTPLTLRVQSGLHEVELRGPGKPRIFKVHVTPGDRVAQYVEFPRRP
jgi:serine/threonine protein kinase